MQHSQQKKKGGRVFWVEPSPRAGCSNCPRHRKRWNCFSMATRLRRHYVPPPSSGHLLNVAPHDPWPIDGQTVALTEERSEAHLLIPEVKEHRYFFFVDSTGRLAALKQLLSAAAASHPRALENYGLQHQPSLSPSAGRAILMLTSSSNFHYLVKKVQEKQQIY